MTNEEKAREIELNIYAFGEKPKGEFQAPAYRAALEMAKWKDQQFREYLRNKAISYKCRGENFFGREIKTIEEIINELFKEGKK